MRLIDADDLYELIDGGYDIDFDELPETKRELLRMIDSQDTVDAVPVVRCKDCKYASPNGEYGCKAYHFKLYETHEMKADDFCSHGERREDDMG